MSTWILASTLFLSPLQPALHVAPPTKQASSPVSVGLTIARLGVPTDLSAEQIEDLQAISQQFIEGDDEALEAWRRFAGKNPSVDVDAAVLFIIRVAYLEYTEDLYHYTAEVRFFNQQKHIVRGHIMEMQEAIKELKSTPGGKDEVISGARLRAPKKFSEGADPVIEGEALMLTVAAWSKEIRRWKNIKARANKSAQAAATKLHTKMKKRKKLYRKMKRTQKALYAAAAG